MRYIKITFTDKVDIEFVDPDTGRKQWYKCFYARGTSMEVLDVLSGNPSEIRVKCLDGETAILPSNCVHIG